MRPQTSSQSTRNGAYFQHRDNGAMGEQEALVMRVFHQVGNEGKDFSLNELGAILGLPASTVSARVNQLKARGFLIEGTPRKHAFSRVRITPLRLPFRQQELAFQ